MFDLSKGPYALKAQSVSAFLSSLEATLPAHMEITLKQVTLKKGGKTPAIQVRDVTLPSECVSLNRAGFGEIY
jgi:hypothetical protein